MRPPKLVMRVGVYGLFPSGGILGRPYVLLLLLLLAHSTAEEYVLLLALLAQGCGTPEGLQGDRSRSALLLD